MRRSRFSALATYNVIGKCVDALGLSESEEAELMAMFPQKEPYRCVPPVWDGKEHTEGLGPCLKSYRRRVGMSRVDLWKKSGVPDYYISKIEHGRHPSDDTLGKLADALGVSRDERGMRVSEDMLKELADALSVSDDERELMRQLNAENKK